MGHIKEPKGIDFVIKSEPLNEKTRKEISEFIRQYKSKNLKNNPRAISKTRKRKVAVV